MEKKNTLDQALRASISVVHTKPYEQQSTEERHRIMARINAIINIRAVWHTIMDNTPHLLAGLPEVAEDKNLKMAKQRLNKVLKAMKESLPIVNEAQRVFDLLFRLTSVEDENVENAGYLVADMVRQIHHVSIQKFATVRKALQMISDGVLTDDHLEKIENEK